MNPLIKPEIRRLLKPYRFTHFESISPGMSGARIYRCCDQHGDVYALKRWPANTAANRIQSIHRVMQAARQAGCELVPRIMDWPLNAAPASLFGDGQFYWDLIQWMPGQPLSSNASWTNIRSGAGAIARFHLATADLDQQQKIAPSVVQRCQLLTTIEHDLLELVKSSTVNSLTVKSSTVNSLTVNSLTVGGVPPTLAEAIANAVGLLRFGWDQVRPRLLRSLSLYLEQPMITQFVLRDVHREHVLFLSGQPSGLIDFDAVRIDSPAADFARWAGSFIGPGREAEPVWAAILAGATTENPSIDSNLDAPLWRLARSLASANPWIGLVQWLRWVLIEGRSFPAGPEVVAGRINGLVDAAAHDMQYME